jgi:hypothetical protein
MADTFKLYRFSPIESDDNLAAAARYVIQGSRKLCEILGVPAAPVGYLTIFSHYEHEYRRLLSLLPALGDVVEANNGWQVSLKTPIAEETDTVELLRIRKPDPYRMHVGCADLKVSDPWVFREKYAAPDAINARVIEREDFNMVEIFDPSVDVLAYVLCDYKL